MRDPQLQTPQGQRDQSSSVRRLKSSSEVSRNARKVTRKSLNPVFKAVSEDSAVLESLKEISEVSDDNLLTESAENFFSLVKPGDTYSSETIAVPDMSSPALSSSSVVTSDKHELMIASDAEAGNPELIFLKKVERVEAELVIKHLSEARIQVLKSKDIDHSKKLLEALVNVIIDEFYGGVYDKKEWLDKLQSNMANLVLLSFMIGIFASFMYWVFNSDNKAFQKGPTPT